MATDAALAQAHHLGGGGGWRGQGGCVILPRRLAHGHGFRAGSGPPPKYGTKVEGLGDWSGGGP